MPAVIVILPSFQSNRSQQVQIEEFYEDIKLNVIFKTILWGINKQVFMH